MIRVVFKNLEKSELAIEAVEEKLESISEKFSDLKKSILMVSLEMENSPLHAGPDLFTVRLHCQSGRFRGVRVQKSAQTLYLALADVAEHLLEVLNRFGDKARIKARNRERKFNLENRFVEYESF